MTATWDSAISAELAFYTAFERGDLDEMMAVWSATSEVACVHPMGPVLTGLIDIRASWAELFAVQVPRKFEIKRVQTIAVPELVLHVLYETISLPLQRQRFAPMAALNGYRPHRGHWRMVLHHAGPVGVEQVGFTPTDASSTRH